ncbi:lipopolysaccharide transport periplasmic protein LptA [Marivita geojedonensis]|uniref:Organic solvent tolerance protein OstA n=1 Tax=Marivita geojedonensis TaxID=1123756 RepID=A0A1X4NQU9_9RHOB|nr:lipopolysaccharide transport periplasmic protein LptA [Marivita geojedonensis]OSQ53300.1 organic solvent tolerance protein OstA [Marivita geojedonensis]PRY81739.1 lipopolysaccharide export system protein LptA [Marivita geojedonensis]
MIRTVMSVVLLGLAPAAFAQGTEVAFGTVQQDTSLPVEVSADALSVSQNDGSALFTGNVIIGQGDMRLSAPRVLVYYTENQSGIERLEATGGVTLVNGDQAAEAESAEYEVNRGTIRMVGNVLLTQGANTLVSDSMDVDLEAGTAQMNGRVRTVFQSGHN